MSEEQTISTPPDLAGEQVAARTNRRHSLQVMGILLLIVLLVAAGMLLGGELGRFVQSGLPHMPFLLLALIGTLGLSQSWARWTSYVWALLVQGAVGYFALNYMLLGLADGPITTPEEVMQSIQPADALLLTVGMALLVVLFGLCSTVLLPQVRTWLARWLPIDPANHTHTIALWVVLYMTTASFAQLMLLNGQPPLLTAITSGAISSADLGNRSELGQSLDLVYQLTWMIPLAFIAAGWPLRRGIGAVLERLGLVVPSWQQIGIAGLSVVGLVSLMTVFSAGTSELWQLFGWPETDAAAFEQLLGALNSPLGAIVIGITAGLGEELAVRGLLQPRLGLVLSNLAFTSIHAYQYSFDALLTVFLLGMLLGLIRARTNTTTAAITHGGYNATIVLLGLLGW